MVCVELIGVPKWGFVTVLVIAVPATLAAILAKTAIEHFLVSALAKNSLVAESCSQPFGLMLRRSGEAVDFMTL